MPRRQNQPQQPLPNGRPNSEGALLADAFAGELTTAIAKGAMKPGSLLPSERELAAHHKVARVTVRAALRKLAGAGLIECCPRVGYKVVECQPDVTRTRPVGLIREDVSSSKNPSRSLGLFESRFAQSGRALLIGSSHLDAREEDGCIRRFKAAGVAGLIIAPATRGERSAELEAWIRAGKPVVLEGHPGRWLLPDELAAQCDRVDVDNRGAVRLALEHLGALGHARIAYVSSGGRAHSERLAAFEEWMEEQGHPACPTRILLDLPNDRTGGAQAFRQLFGVLPPERPTAVLSVGSDDLALGFIAEARAARCRCPEDLSVISFGDNRLVEDLQGLQSLTALEFSQQDNVQITLRLLEDQMDGRRRRPQIVRLPIHLVPGATCARVPSAAEPCPDPGLLTQRHKE